MDFIGGLPTSGRYDTIFVVVDRMSKYAHFIPLKHPYTAKTVATVFCKEIVRLHGFPSSIVSDRDVIFMSNFWEESFRMSGTRLQRSSGYHPESDGQTEVLNRCIEAYLRCFTSEQPAKWSDFLCWAEYSYNTNFHSSLKMTPFKAVYGRDPPEMTPYSYGDTANATLEDQILERDAMLELLPANLLKAQQRMKAFADTKRREISFEEGDLVYLRLQPYRQQSLTRRRYQKLAPRFFGPYKIVRRIGPVAYELELPAGSRIHPVFHVSLLKRAHGNQLQASTFPLPITKDWEIDLIPKDTLAHRWTGPAAGRTLELLVSWKDRPIEEATWEEYDLLKEQFPSFRLEDKSSFGEGSIDKTPMQVYARRDKKKQGDHYELAGYADPQTIFEMAVGKPPDPYAVNGPRQF